jgi:hypothetical protein
MNVYLINNKHEIKAGSFESAYSKCEKRNISIDTCHLDDVLIAERLIHSVVTPHDLKGIK